MPNPKTAFICAPNTRLWGLVDKVFSLWKVLHPMATTKVVRPLAPLQRLLEQYLPELAETKGRPDLDVCMSKISALLEQHRPGFLHQYILTEARTMGTDSDMAILAQEPGYVCVVDVTDRKMAQMLKDQGYLMVFVSSTLAHRRQTWEAKSNSPFGLSPSDLPPGEHPGEDAYPGLDWVSELMDLEVSVGDDEGEAAWKIVEKQRKA